MVSVSRAVAFLTAFGAVNAGEDTQPATISTTTKADAHAATFAAVLPGGLSGVSGGSQQNIVLCIQAGVIAGLNLAPGNENIAAVVMVLIFPRGSDGDIVTGAES